MSSRPITITARSHRNGSRNTLPKNGGEVLSIDFFPLDVTNFGSTISKIQAAKPDFVVSALVGGAHISFYRQWAAAGMRKSIPMASTTFAVGNEHIVLSPDECNGMLVCYNYFQDLKNKTNEAFVAAFHKRSAPTIPTSPNSRWEPIKASVCGRRRSRRPEASIASRSSRRSKPKSASSALGQSDDRSADPPLRARCSHRRGQ